MSMKKFLVPALALLLLVFTLTACGFAPASADTAYAAGSDLYICISPSDEELVSSERASVSGIVVKRDPAGADVFRLIKSYYYPVTSYGDIYVLGGEFEGSGFYIKRYDDNGNKIITDDMEVRADELPAGAAQTSPLLPLTIADGKYVTLNNALPVYAGDTSFELYYLGASAAGGSNLAFLAKSDAVTDYGIADASSFLSFTVGWHPAAEARRAETGGTARPRRSRTRSPGRRPHGRRAFGRSAHHPHHRHSRTRTHHSGADLQARAQRRARLRQQAQDGEGARHGL